MTSSEVMLSIALLAAVFICVKPLGLYIANVMEGRPIWPLRVGARFEVLIYRVCGAEPSTEMGWKRYAMAFLLFNAVGAVAVYLLQRLQQWLPLNPQQFSNVSPDSSFNTAVSFVTNTNWQGYSGESTMSYLTQMAGLAVQNFLSAASGIVVAIVLIRGLARHTTKTIGNYWVDLTRCTLYILLPIATILALVLVSQGVVQNFSSYKEVATLEPSLSPKLDRNGTSKATLATDRIPILLPAGPPSGPVRSTRFTHERMKSHEEISATGVVAGPNRAVRSRCR